MHNHIIATLLSVFLLTPSSALAIPPTHLHDDDAATIRTSQSFLSDQQQQPTNQCTFTLSHRQLLPSTKTHPGPAKVNYIRLPSIADHANNLTIDVAHARPNAAFNSYVRLSSTERFAVDGLLGEKRLVVSAREGDDTLRFKLGSAEQEEEALTWVAGSLSENMDLKSGGAWCEIPGGWEERVGGRVRNVECGFPCEKITEEEEERMELR